tara:strand:+ start:396 stop:1058 length:663 start_codon:yes stop_codon:yes gene_type:complete
MNTPQQLDLFPELNSTVDYGNATYTLDTNGSLPYTLTYSIDDQMSQAVSLTDNVDVKIYKLFPEAHMPELGTEWAACFDLKASLRDSDEITVFNATNTKSKRKYANGSIFIYSGERALIPTGLVFDLDENQSMRIHPRSGLAFKNGITLANSEGVVDSDYVQQTYVMLYNMSDKVFIVEDGDRIAQAEVLESYSKFVFEEVFDEPETKTSRTGGFGSTGV